MSTEDFQGKVVQSVGSIVRFEKLPGLGSGQANML